MVGLVAVGKLYTLPACIITRTATYTTMRMFALGYLIVFRRFAATRILTAAIISFLTISSAFTEPVVMNGAMVPELVGARVAAIRVVNSAGEALPFQIDEVTAGGEYVCPQGQNPNADSGNGILDLQDEIVFLSEDMDSGEVSPGTKTPGLQKRIQVKVSVCRGPYIRTAHIVEDDLVPRSLQNYLQYDHTRQFLRTPYYYAQFGKDRFHFTRAGCMDFSSGKFIDLANELRVDIRFRALWGLLPIRYTEENIVCKVMRYKTGPVRIIRRGNFYLSLGLGVKGSQAIVYQICYPQVVKAPVRVFLPVKFSRFFSESFIEMTPVIRKDGEGFRFVVPGIGYTGELSGNGTVDTLIRAIPKKGYSVTDGAKGFEWVTTLAVDDQRLAGSGYVLRKPSKRKGIADCGFRLAVNDLPRGRYDIVNWVFFPGHSPVSEGKGLTMIHEPAVITVLSRTFTNLLVAPPAEQKK